MMSDDGIPRLSLDGSCDKGSAYSGSGSGRGWGSGSGGSNYNEDTRSGGWSSRSSSSLLAAFEVALVAPRGVTASGTVLGSTVNLTNTIVGGGMLALPFAFKSAGLALGAAMLVTVALVTSFSVKLLVEAGQRTRRPLFTQLTEVTLGPRWVSFVQLCIIVQSYGTCIGYYIIFTDMMVPLAPHTPRPVLAAIALAVTAPLVCLRSIAALRYTSLLAMGAISFLLAVVAFRASEALSTGSHEGASASDRVPVGPIVLVNFSPDIALAVPIAAFAYSCHFNIPSIVAELRNPTDTRVSIFVRSALAFVTTVYAAVGVSGYLTFRGEVGGNILNSYPPDDILVDVARVALALVVTFSVPLMIHPSRIMLEQMLCPGQIPGENILRSRALALTLVLLAYTTSAVVSDISTVFGLVGSTVTPIVSYLLPAAFYLSIPVLPGRRSARKTMGAYALIATGVTVMLVSTTVNIVQLAS